jgi:transketolase
MTMPATSPKPPPVNTTLLDERSLALRRTIVRTLERGGRGHVGSAFSLVEMLRVLYDDVLRFDPKQPRWPGRDRFVLSKGHGCLALYALLADKGFFPEDELWRFCKPDGILGGHPEYGKVPGIEASTGSLGHGLSFGVGFALNARIDAADYRVFVVSSDGESNEGSVWEAALAAGKHRLANLTVLVDYNKQQSYSTTYEVLDLDPFADKWRAFGFAVEEVDGHDVAQLRGALGRVPFQPDRPSCIICHTIKGKGVPFVENNLNWHHKNKVTEDEVRALNAALQPGGAHA